MQRYAKKIFLGGNITYELGCSRNRKANGIRAMFSKHFRLKPRDKKQTNFRL